MATSKRHRTDLTLGQKLEIVSVMERERPSQAELTKRFKSKIAKSKDAILKEAEKNKFATRKQKRASKDDDVDAALYTWFVDAKARDAPAILEEKANHFASVLEKDFKATNGWLCRWKTRHGIKI
ncbi:Tigger transposable element-derived protein 3 [Geodia barretti]|uniref:Tigger transposable element-derived protein 3 n=1 Tax=Geodia barretti TaxID=519541 RepID=A0AA35TD52_GEOBA|nr:Tigger transposable element-derived protein 3 [Geodia barretti]